MSKTVFFIRLKSLCENTSIELNRVLVRIERESGVYILIGSTTLVSWVNISTKSAGLRDPTTPADFNQYLLLFLPANVILRCLSILTHRTLKPQFHRRLLHKKTLKSAPGQLYAASKPVRVVRYLPAVPMFET